jgi:hypothetical protein
VVIIAFGVFETVRPKPDTTSEHTVRFKPDTPSATSPTSPVLAQTETGTGGVQAFRPGSARTSAPTDRRAPSELDALSPARLDVNSIAVAAMTVERLTPPSSLGVQDLDPIAPLAVTPLTTAGENR